MAIYMLTRDWMEVVVRMRATVWVADRDSDGGNADGNDDNAMVVRE